VIKIKMENILLIGTLALVLGVLIFAVSGFFGNNNKIINNAIFENSNFETKISESRVTIDLTPKEFKKGKLYVDIGVNTHSVNLGNYDLKSLTVLEFEGKSIKPISAPKLSGHHNSGTLIFDVGKELRIFKIKIRGIPEIEERTFEWS
jgi:hypothetical protein